MKIVTISDTHGKHNELDLSKYPGDVLVHAGDFTDYCNKADIMQFLDWLSEQPFKHKILIAGNHETLLEESTAWFYHVLSIHPSIEYLQDTAITIDGIKFYGSPYSNKLYNWSFMAEEEELSRIWAEIPEDTQVLITHGPAYGHHDKVNGILGYDPHLGSKSLAERKLALQGTLKAHISGHIHEGYGTSLTGSCKNVCPCVLNEKYQLINKPITITVSNDN